MNRVFTSVVALLLAGSAGAFAGSGEKSHDDTRPHGAASEKSAESNTQSTHRNDDSSVGDRSRDGDQDSDLGTMGTGNTGTTGGMGATTGTDTIGGTIEE